MNDNVMWNRQSDFLWTIESQAQELLKKLAPDLKLKGFLLGVLIDEQQGKNSIYLEPSDCDYEVSDFSSLTQLDKKIINTSPSNQHKYKTEIEAKLNQYPDFDVSISDPIEYHGFLVFVGLRLPKKSLDKYCVKGTNYSLIDQLRSVYLDQLIKEFKVYPNTEFFFIKRNYDELIREAGRNFMSFAVNYFTKLNDLNDDFDGDFNNKLDFLGLYDNCNIIFSLKYEGEEGAGKMVIAEKDHPNIKYNLQLQEPIKIQEFRKVRKFLQLANEDSPIISDTGFIYGLGKIINNNKTTDQSLLFINFLSHYKWEFVYDDQSMMIVEYGQPRLPKESIAKKEFYSKLKRIFKEIEETQLRELWKITKEATKQKHGTMLVITDKAKEESERLGQQCFPVKCFPLNPSIVQQITSIDGAVLIDRNSDCYAIGVILDGNSKPDKGDASRGARYNSAIRYYEQHGKNNSTVLVIISEDGMINLYPELKPQIKHSEITNVINYLESLSKKDETKTEEIDQTISWLKNKEFYLSPKECVLINKLIKSIHKKLENFNQKYKKFQEFKPNEDMNESYYLEEQLDHQQLNPSMFEL